MCELVVSLCRYNSLIVKKIRMLPVFAAVCTLAGAIRTGPEVGQSVPRISLPDQTGATRTLESILGPKGALLVFFRSADW